MDENISYCDPHSEFQRKESGLTGGQLLALARKLGWRRTRIYGRWWISRQDLDAWLASQKREKALHIRDTDHRQLQRNEDGDVTFA